MSLEQAPFEDLFEQDQPAPVQVHLLHEKFAALGIQSQTHAAFERIFIKEPQEKSDQETVDNYHTFVMNEGKPVLYRFKQNIISSGDAQVTNEWFIDGGEGALFFIHHTAKSGRDDTKLGVVDPFNRERKIVARYRSIIWANTAHLDTFESQAVPPLTVLPINNPEDVETEIYDGFDQRYHKDKTIIFWKDRVTDKFYGQVEIPKHIDNFTYWMAWVEGSMKDVTENPGQHWRLWPKLLGLAFRTSPNPVIERRDK